MATQLNLNDPELFAFVSAVNAWANDAISASCSGTVEGQIRAHRANIRLLAEHVAGDPRMSPQARARARTTEQNLRGRIDELRQGTGHES